MTKPEWAIRDVRENSSGTYYTLNQATAGSIGTTATVTVKHCTNYDRHVCLTCLTNDCRHTRFVRDYLKEIAA